MKFMSKVPFYKSYICIRTRKYIWGWTEIKLHNGELAKKYQV